MQKAIKFQLIIFLPLISGFAIISPDVWCFKGQTFQRPTKILKHSKEKKFESGWRRKGRKKQEKSCKFELSWRNLLHISFVFFSRRKPRWRNFHRGCFYQTYLTFATRWSLMCVIYSHLICLKTGFTDVVPLLMLWQTGWSSLLKWIFVYDCFDAAPFMERRSHDSLNFDQREIMTNLTPSIQSPFFRRPPCKYSSYVGISLVRLIVSFVAARLCRIHKTT